MSLPLVLTTVTILEKTGERDRSTPVTYQTVEAGVPATITNQAGIGTPSQAQADAFLHVAIGTPVSYPNRVLDEGTGQFWDVVWTIDRVGLGLDMRIGGLIRVEGAA